MTWQGRPNNLTVITFEKVQRDPSLGQFCAEPTLCDQRFPSVLEPPTKRITLNSVAEDLQPVTLNFRVPVATAGLELHRLPCTQLLWQGPRAGGSRLGRC